MNKKGCEIISDMIAKVNQNGESRLSYYHEVQRRIRKNHNLTQEEIALKMGVARSYIGRMESSRTPSLNYVVDLCDALVGIITPEEKRDLHRAGARDKGWEIEL